MALRNFWTEVKIDGRESVLSGGPRSKDGGLYITIYQRMNGSKEEVVTINCWADSKGKLHTVVRNKVSGENTEILTER